MNDNVQLEDMVRYLRQEVPDTEQDGFRSLKPAGDFEYDLGVEGDPAIIRVRVYEVQLNSGKKIFAADSGFDGSVGNFITPQKNVYYQELPDAETASKVHLYTAVALIGVFALSLDDRSNRREQNLKEGLKEFADRIGLPEQFRSNYDVEEIFKMKIFT